MALEAVDFAVAERAAREILLRRDIPEALRALAAGLLAEHDGGARQLVGQHARSRHAPTRRACAQALALMPPGAPAEIGAVLAQLALDPEPDIARVAIQALGKHLSPEACNVCLRALHKPLVRGAAMRALAELGAPVINPIGEALGQEREDPSIAAALTWALGQIGSAAGIAPMVQTLGADHATSRLCAAVALTSLHQRRPTIPLPTAELESRYLPEIAYYASARDVILSGLPTTQTGTLLRRTVKQRSHASLETLFRLFALRYAEDSVLAAFGAIISHDRAQRQVAIELLDTRSEERRVGKECRSRWSPYH